MSDIHNHIMKHDTFVRHVTYLCFGQMVSISSSSLKKPPLIFNNSDSDFILLQIENCRRCASMERLQHVIGIICLGQVFLYIICPQVYHSAWKSYRQTDFHLKDNKISYKYKSLIINWYWAYIYFQNKHTYTIWESNYDSVN